MSGKPGRVFANTMEERGRSLMKIAQSKKIQSRLSADATVVQWHTKRA